MTAADELRQLLNGYQVSQAIHVAAVLQISDLLADGPLSAAELADRTECNASALGRLMRALAAVGIYTEDPADTFANADLGEALRSGADASVCDIAANIGRPYNWSPWGHLLESIRTGDNAFRSLHGINVWEHRTQNDDDAIAFNRAMTAMSAPVVEQVATSYDFTGLRTVVDIGGGQGALISAILEAHPGCRGILFDLPQALAAAPAYLAARELTSRVEVSPGDFFEAIPSGGDAYVLKSVLHDWEDDECTAILQRCRASMEPGTICLIVERVVEGPGEGLLTKLSDLNMLVMPGGRERSVEEFTTLLGTAGLKVTRTIETSTLFRVIESVAV